MIDDQQQQQQQLGNNDLLGSAGAKEQASSSDNLGVQTQVRPSLFDEQKVVEAQKLMKTSMWSKNVPLLPKKTDQRTAEGILMKKTKKDGSWKQYRFELIGSKFVRFFTQGSTKRADKYMCIENFRLEKLKCESKTSVFYGFRLTQNQQFIELFARSKEEMQIWFDALKRQCVLTTFSNDFSTIKLMGKGNFARVYYSRSRMTGGEFAVKAFEKAKFASVDVDRASLIKEISILRKLNHPGVIKMFDVYENHTHVFLVNELLKGGELMHKLKSHGQFSEPQVMRIVKNLLESLRYLVDKNILHRDIKPENLILRSKSDEEIDVVLADFGLADYYDEKGGYMFSRCGTPGYVAPEVLADKLYDFKIDCFSVGVIMFILLTGYSPFKGKSYDEIVIKNYNCDINFDFPDSITDSISLECIDLLKKLLKKDPVTRIGSEDALRHPWFQKRNSTSNTSIQGNENSSKQLIASGNSSPVDSMALSSLQARQPNGISLKTKTPLMNSKWESPNDKISPNTWKKTQYGQRLSSHFNESGEVVYSANNNNNNNNEGNNRIYHTSSLLNQMESPKIFTPGGNQYSQPKSEQPRKSQMAMPDDSKSGESKGISRMMLGNNSPTLQGRVVVQAKKSTSQSQYALAEGAKSIREKLVQNL